MPTKFPRDPTMHAKDNWAMTHFRISICSLPNGSIFMYVSTVTTINLQRFKEAQSQAWGFYIVASSETFKMSVWLMWTCANMIKKKKNILSSHAQILNLHSLSLCQLMFPCLMCWTFVSYRLHNEVLQSRNNIIIPLCVYWFILTVHFILENWLLFWYNCGLHEKSSAEKLIFLCKCCKCTYCSCVMLYDWSVMVIVCVGEDHSGKNGLPEIFHQYISDFTKRKLLKLCWFPHKRGTQATG